MLHQTNLSRAAQPIPYRGSLAYEPAANVRVAFQRSTAINAVAASISKLPAPIRETTLEDIAAAAAPSVADWHRACRALNDALTVAEGTPAKDEKAFSDACSTVADAQQTVLTTPAPTVKELGKKVSLFFAIDAHEFDEPAIGASISADVKRLLVAPETPDDPTWIAAVERLNDVNAKLAVRGLDDDTVDALATEQTAAAEALVDLPSRSSADVLAKIRALSDLNVSVETARLTPLLAELESFTAAGAAPAYSPYMRGPLIQWQKAYAIYEEARAAVIAFDRDVNMPACLRWQEFGKRLTPDDLRNLDPEAATAAADFDKSQDRYDHLVDVQGDAADRLLQLPAPGPAELAIKLRLLTENYGWTASDSSLGTLLLADARRFGRLGAYARADNALLAAYRQQRAVVEPNIDVDDLGAIDEAAYFAAFDATMGVINAAHAATVEGVLTKLRVAFRDGAGQRWSDRAIIDPSHPDFKAGLATSSPTDRLLWSAIEDLARIGGVSLGEQGA